MILSSVLNVNADKVSLKGAFGNSVSVTLVNIPVRLVDADDARTTRVPVLLSCAVTDELRGDLALITHEDYDALCEKLEEFVPGVQLLADTHVMYNDPRILSNQDAVTFETKAVSQADTQAVSQEYCI